MTEGILLKEFIHERKLRKYSYLIIDEAHERGLNSDIILGLLKQLSSSKSKIKFIIMSATLETLKFKTFFQKGSNCTCNIINVEGRFFPIEIMNLTNPVEDYIQASLNTILKIHFKEKKGDILVFLTGREEIEDLKGLLEEKI